MDRLAGTNSESSGKQNRRRVSKIKAIGFPRAQLSQRANPRKRPSAVGCAPRYFRPLAADGLRLKDYRNVLRPDGPTIRQGRALVMWLHGSSNFSRRRRVIFALLFGRDTQFSVGIVFGRALAKGVQDFLAAV